MSRRFIKDDQPKLACMFSKGLQQYKAVNATLWHATL
jgi:hypothetical protein